MNLFSEIYGAYYNIIAELLKAGSFKEAELRRVVEERGFGETMLYLIPKISEGEISLFERDGEVYTSVLSGESAPAVPLSLLQKRWLAAILSDRRIGLFLDEEEVSTLQTALGGVEPLFNAGDFIYTDRFTDGDDYESETYRKHFRIILKAIRERQILNINFNSGRGQRVHFRFIPCKLEYSVKNDKFRLHAVDRRHSERYGNKDILYTINLSRISELSETGKYLRPRQMPKLDKLITKGYYKEPVTLLIKTERNALERAMLQFAAYKKNTTRIRDDLYKCEIYYNESNETELLIEVLSFGSAVEVLGSEKFKEHMSRRIEKQKELFAAFLK